MEKTNLSISVVIPVYNASKTILSALESIPVDDRFDIICVDDGSTDGSSEIIEGFASRNKNVHLIYQDNKGAAAARNTGLENISGDYVMFLDADDQYSDNALQKIYDDLYEYNPDYAVFQRVWCRKDGERIIEGGKRSDSIKNYSIPWYKYVNEKLLLQQHGTVVYTKVFRADIIKNNNIRFCESLTLSEDLFFLLSYLPFAKSFVEDFSVLYYQNEVDGSLMRRSRPNFYVENLKAINIYQKQNVNEYDMIQPFIYQFMFLVGTAAIRRAREMRDCSNIQECKSIIANVLADKGFMESIRIQSMTNDIFSKQAAFLNKHGELLYSIRYYYLGRVKHKIKNVIKILRQ